MLRSEMLEMKRREKAMVNATQVIGGMAGGMLFALIFILGILR